MEHSIYFYTGTGNSLWTARTLGGFCKSAEIIPINHHKTEAVQCNSERIGIVFPVHIWGVPPPVLNFVARLKIDPGQYLFALAVHAGQVAATLIQLQGILQKKQLILSSGFSIELPSNYIVWRGAVSKEKQQQKFIAAAQKLERIALILQDKKVLPPEKGPIWQNPFFSWAYRRTFPHIGKMDKSFFADDKCNACGICVKLCPADNIVLTGKKPVWRHRCEQCFACIQWCPEEAVQAGKSTKNKIRYHHPEISLKDMLACAPDRKK